MIPFFIILMELFNIVVESVGSNDALIIGSHGCCDLILAINNKLMSSENGHNLNTEHVFFFSILLPVESLANWSCNYLVLLVGRSSWSHLIVTL